MQNLARAITLCYDESPVYLDFTRTSAELLENLSSLRASKFALWISDPDSLSILDHHIAIPSHIHILIFNGLGDALAALLRFSSLGERSLPPLTIYTFDPIPLPLKQAFSDYTYKVISYPFCATLFKVNINSSAVSYAAEFKHGFIHPIESIVSSISSFTSSQATLSDYLSHKRYASDGFLSARERLYSKLTDIDLFDFISAEQRLATTLTDIYRLGLAFRLNNLRQDHEVRLQGNHFSEIGLTSLPTDRIHSSVLRGTISIDPGSHTLSNHSYFRPCDLLDKGALPVPIGYSYDHITSEPNIPFVPDTTSASLTELFDALHSLKYRTFLVRVLGSFPFTQ